MQELIIEASDDIFALPKTRECVCVTTNGMVKSNGNAVMGRGIALYADKNYHVAGKLAGYLKQYGNRAFNLGLYPNIRTGEEFFMFSFPTKENWRDDSKVDLIEQSAKQIVEMCNKFGIQKCYLPPVGCANGHLDYNTQVKPVIAPILDDRFVIVFRKEN